MTAVGILPVVSELARLLEDDDESVDHAGAEPKDWIPGRLFIYPSGRLAEVPFETGPSRRQDFGVVAVFIARSSEAALRATDEEISALIDEKRAQYLERVRTNQVTVLWHHIQAAERPAPRTLDGRGVAIDITGYRLID